MATALKYEALSLLELFSEAINRRVMLECRKNNTQCISTVRTEYSAVLGHLPRTETIAVGVVSETFDSDDCYIVYLESALHKGNVFTKRPSRAMFEPAMGLRRPTASGRVRRIRHYPAEHRAAVSSQITTASIEEGLAQKPAPTSTNLQERERRRHKHP